MENLVENKIKIVGFSQLRNELENGNLENWMKCMQTICDVIYIYDQNSTDGSKDYYKQFNNVIVIESPINDFENELICKDILLQKLIKEQPDTKFICWFDGDCLLDNRILNYDKIRDILSVIPETIDAVNLSHYNLWRSDIHYRIDNLYDYLNQNGRSVFWRIKEGLHFPRTKGLHNQANERPIGINTMIRLSDYTLIHRGFATSKSIIDRYDMYKKTGQNGYLLERLRDETTLEVIEMDKKLLPSWFKITDEINPKNKEKIVDLMNKMK